MAKSDTIVEYRVQRQNKNQKWVPLRIWNWGNANQLSGSLLADVKMTVAYYRRKRRFKGKVRYIKVTTTTTTKVIREIVK